MRRSPATEVVRENLAGLVERVTFHNDDSGFCVLRVKARGQRDLSGWEAVGAVAPAVIDLDAVFEVFRLTVLNALGIWIIAL